MTFSAENILLIGSLMMFFSIFVSKAGYRFGVPSLLLFLFVGMAMGQDGLGYRFDNSHMAQFIGVMALSVILFSGGMDTKYSEIRPVAIEGIVLSTLGVALTALLTGTFIYYLAQAMYIDLPFPHSLLLASVMSSTDSASVFGVLRSKGLKLRENLRPALELESGSNDPMAFVLTIALIQYLQEDVVGWKLLVSFLMQIAIGAVLGFFLGKLTVRMVNSINLDNRPLYSVFLLTCVFFIFSLTDALHGNGYLAVYLAGLVVGNNRMVHKKSMALFFDDFSWLWQIVMFLTLGLLVNPSELLEVAWFGLAIGAFMIVFGRPLAVLTCLLPFKKFSRGARSYICWVGLRGAVPIIFATYPLIAEVEYARMIFNVVFFITIMSLSIQGMSVHIMAKIFGVADDTPDSITEFGLELPDEIKAAMSEIEVTSSVIANGDTLKTLKLPDKTLVIMAKRGDAFFIPKGDTALKVGDKLLVISDDADELRRVYDKLGISNYTFEKNS